MHAGLAVAMPFIHTWPRYSPRSSASFYWIGEDRIQFSSDYAPDAALAGRAVRGLPDPRGPFRVRLTTEQKKKILGLNAAKMYDLAVPEEPAPEAEETATGPRQLLAGRTWRGRPEMSVAAASATSSRESAYAALGDVPTPKPTSRSPTSASSGRSRCTAARRAPTSWCTCACRRRSARRTSRT